MNMMPRKLTISLSDEMYARLESLALENDATAPMYAHSLLHDAIKNNPRVWDGTRICRGCGGHFTPREPRVRYCDGEQCRDGKARNRNAQRAFQERRKTATGGY